MISSIVGNLVLALAFHFFICNIGTRFFRKSPGILIFAIIFICLNYIPGGKYPS